MVKNNCPNILKSKKITAIALIFCLFIAFAPAVRAEGAEVYPGGMPFGIRFSTDGVLVVGVADVETPDGNVSPGSKAGLKPEDVITAVNGVKPDGAEDLKKAAEASNGKSIELTVRRGDKTFRTELTPVISSKDGRYRSGLWIRDGSAGIGTVTFIMPGSLEFAGLGHGICDNETGALLPVREGRVLDVSISGVKPGTAGIPGELTGFLTAKITGELILNAQSGAYGVFEKMPENIPSGTVSAASPEETVEGPAFIYCTVDGNDVKKYSVEIERIDKSGEKEKNFIVRVTDKSLLEKTGGIVQGMSGSPVIQNGKLVGAVTHVMINDPERGYGIFIENMLDNMPRIAA